MSERPNAQLAPMEIRRAFNRAAKTFDEYAVLHREIGQRLVDRLQYMQIDPAIVVDLGAGTGYSARLLEARYRRARILLLDSASAMLVEARKTKRRWFSRTRFLCTDAAHICLADRSADMIFSNLTLPWCENLIEVFKECHRILRPGGLLLFSTLGPATLHELRAAWATIDQQPHVNIFLDMHDVGDTLIRSGFSAPVLDRENLILTYREVTGLLRDLKGTGTHNSHIARARGLTGRVTFEALRKAYESSRREGVLPATYEIVFGHAWVPLPDSRPQDGSTVATFPFKNLRRSQ